MVTILFLLLLLCLFFLSLFLNLSLWTALILLLNRQSFSLASIMIFSYHVYSNCDLIVVIRFLSSLRLIFLRTKTHAIFFFISPLPSTVHGPGSRAIASSYHTFVKFRKVMPSGQVHICRHKAWSVST